MRFYKRTNTMPPRPGGWLIAMKCRDTEKGGVLGQIHPLPLLPPLCAVVNRGQAGALVAQLAGQGISLKLIVPGLKTRQTSSSIVLCNR